MCSFLLNESYTSIFIYMVFVKFRRKKQQIVQKTNLFDPVFVSHISDWLLFLFFVSFSHDVNSIFEARICVC